MKYILKKKWHPSQVEEVGHVFEVQHPDVLKYFIDDMTIYYIYPHEIALLCEAGYLEKENNLDKYADIINTAVANLYKQKKPEVDIDKILQDRMILPADPQLEKGVSELQKELNKLPEYGGIINDSQLDLWESPPPIGTIYWYLKIYKGNLIVEHDDFVADTLDNSILLAKNCHRTKESAKEALKRLLA